MNEWKRIREIINQVSFKELKIREEKFSFLKPSTDLFGRKHMFISKFKVHEIKEEKYVSTEPAEVANRES